MENTHTQTKESTTFALDFFSVQDEKIILSLSHILYRQQKFNDVIGFDLMAILEAVNNV